VFWASIHHSILQKPKYSTLYLLCIKMHPAVLPLLTPLGRFANRLPWVGSDRLNTRSLSANSTCCTYITGGITRAETRCYITRANSGSALSRVGIRMGIWQIKINKTTIYPDVYFTAGNRVTLPQCGKEVVVFSDCILVMLIANDDDDDDCYPKLLKTYCLLLVAKNQSHPRMYVLHLPRSPLDNGTDPDSMSRWHCSSLTPHRECYLDNQTWIINRCVLIQIMSFGIFMSRMHHRANTGPFPLLFHWPAYFHWPLTCFSTAYFDGVGCWYIVSPL